MMKDGKVGSVVHKHPITSEQMQELFRSGQLGDSNTKDPSQLLRTAWFYLTLYFGKGGRENQRKLTKEILVLQTTPQERRYYEIRRNALISTKNHQGGLKDSTDESDGKMFEVINSGRCPVKTIENFLKHLNPNLDCLFQRPREQSAKFNPEKESVWYCNSPVGESTLANMMKTMSRAAGITPHLTNHCVRATAVTVLSDRNVEARHIKAVTGHKSDSSIESYNARAYFPQKENMSNILSGFVAGEESSLQPLAIQNRSDVQIQMQNENYPSSSSAAVTSSKVYQQSNNHLPQSFTFHGCTVSIVNNNNNFFR